MDAISSKHGSFWGKLLRVNLTNDTWKIDTISKDTLKRFIGGRGLGIKILYDELDPSMEPLSQHNILVFATGPLTGTPVPTACRYEVITKSPLSGTITGASAGGYFGASLKQEGYDAIVISGIADSPRYLWINDGEVTIKDANCLWGSTTHDTTEKIIKELDNNKISVACIGPAGERLVRFASIINDKHRAAGRGGVGAVMGSKKLKAIAVSGSNKLEISDLKRLSAQRNKTLKKIKTTTVTSVNLPEFGTAKIMDSSNDYRLLGTRNFQQSYFEHAGKINAKQLKNKLLVKRNTCFSCPIACKRVTKVGNRTGEGPEFETLWSFGAMCGIDDLNAIARVNYLCNDLGLDTISTGSTIACAMELAERGYIAEKIPFGDPAEIEKLVSDIGHREGLGDKLAEGSYRFASSAEHPEISMSVKQLELPAYDPRIAHAQGLGYATSPRGACHVRAFVVKSDMVAGPQKTDHKTINTKTRLVKTSQDRTAVIDSLGMCLFSSFVCSIEDYLEYFEAATGIAMGSPDELLRSGERIWNLERLFNLKAGFSKGDDKLPKRFTQEKVTDSLDNEHIWPEKELIVDYYRERGWTADGIPTKKKLNELGLEFGISD
jgi:aldehyde:ferredoxin oxidoreductase